MRGLGASRAAGTVRTSCCGTCGRNNVVPVSNTASANGIVDSASRSNRFGVDGAHRVAVRDVTDLRIAGNRAPAVHTRGVAELIGHDPHGARRNRATVDRGGVDDALEHGQRLGAVCRRRAERAIERCDTLFGKTFGRGALGEESFDGGVTDLVAGTDLDGDELAAAHPPDTRFDSEHRGGGPPFSDSPSSPAPHVERPHRRSQGHHIAASMC